MRYFSEQRKQNSRDFYLYNKYLEHHTLKKVWAQKVISRRDGQGKVRRAVSELMLNTLDWTCGERTFETPDLWIEPNINHHTNAAEFWITEYYRHRLSWPRLYSQDLFCFISFWLKFAHADNKISNIWEL